jgi:ribonuclease T2
MKYLLKNVLHHKLASLLIVITSFLFSPLLYASERIEGCFIATETCEAFRSIKKKSNPDHLKLTINSSYKVHAKNKPSPSHYQITIPNNTTPLRWVSTSCGRYLRHCQQEAEASHSNNDRRRGNDKNAQYLLALSWEPSFCETHGNKPECKTLTSKRYDATHLSLHGLWPQPKNNAYCGIGDKNKAIDRRKKWHLLPKLNLTTETIKQLKVTMPGYLSNLQRHEWIKHGTCYGTPANQYYRDSIALTQLVNNSPVGTLLKQHSGKTLTVAKIKATFDTAFGKGSGKKIAVKCDRKGRLAELWINLKGKYQQGITLNKLLGEADKATKGNCTTAFIDTAR